MQFRTALVVAVVAIAFVAGAASASTGEVLDLNEKTFDAAIAEHDLTLVEFFAPWCGHCKSLAPEYDKAAKDLVGKNAGVLAKVDCTVERDLCGRFDVKGFPTLKLFRKESPTAPSEYDQARKAEAIVKFMVKQNQPAVTELASEDAVAGFAAGENVKVVGYGAVPALAGVASALRNEFSFASVASASGAARVVLFRNFDEGDVTFTGDLASASELTAFIKGQSFPLVGEIGPENYQKYLERGFNFVWVFIDPESEEQTKLITDVVTPTAAVHRNALSFVKLDGLRWAEHAKSFGLSGSTPGIVLENRQKSRNFVFGEKDVTAANFAAWVQGVVDGSIAPTVKSEPVPTSNDGPVTVVVGHTFESIVLDDTKDVLVEFYAPWCGHCKTLAPKYDELGALFADDASTVVAKIDATANDSPAEVSGFPTLIFYPAGDKSNPITYNGARTAEAMAEFIRENKKAAVAAAAEVEAPEAHGEEL